MIWNRSNTIGLAKATCVHCQGCGMKLIRKSIEVPCNCVLRAIFRACYNRFRECEALAERTGAVALEFVPGSENQRVYSRKREEFICDFDLVSRRALNDFEKCIFKYHFLLGADWKLCCRRLHIDRGTFFHAVYHMEEKLGRIFAELRPYALYPLEEYFSLTMRRRRAA